MKYVKLTQAQLDEIQALLNNKNETIEILTSKIDELESDKNIREERNFYKEDNAKLCNELDRVEDDLRIALEQVSNLEKELLITKETCFEEISAIQKNIDSALCELSIQKSVNKTAIKMLNECNPHIPNADLSNILDISV
jgi:chromosome segregation ATPase